MIRKLSILLFLMILVCMVFAMTAWAQGDTTDELFPNVEWSVCYVHSFETGDNLFLPKASVKLAEPTLFGLKLPIYGNALLFADDNDYSSFSGISVGGGFSTVVSDALLGFDIGLAYLPGEQRLSYTVDMITIPL